ncbi:DUF4348 domain-containing protein [Flavobacterium reichenbachii]|uniref:DUF4348 domain-containing protein n=1 Tax=Flavobacterium reichenbachii TaxID=362418 RepID=A0A085ZJA1_9FLAO|nr:DUF4348 domain-containing protein [Flavobacterium reichenbachii]KFF04515.1 hypothetical protein IW19_02780 [Flavobacterium reichenbachii]OXB09304.1 DUF4348 domain-containing protein [Flavobacterium reichenbachii]
MKKALILFCIFLLNNSLTAQNKAVYKEEVFSSFLKKFKESQDFQLSRIHFPLTVKMNNDDYELVDYVIAKSDYKMIRLDDKGSQYQQKNVPKNSTVIIKQRGKDNGIFVEYIFIQKKGLWYLKTWVDMST